MDHACSPEPHAPRARAHASLAGQPLLEGLEPRLLLAAAPWIGDLVWVDVNGDGIQDAEEPGIQTATVHLYQPGADGQVGGGDDALVAATTTGPGGEYLFEDLAAGDYFLEIEAPTGYTFTTQDAGDDTLDSDVDAATGRTGVFALAAGGEDLTRDAGLLGPVPGEIHGVKWEDLDWDGEQDPGEPRMGGVTIYADLNQNGEPDTGEPVTVTSYDDPDTPGDETGTYELIDLPPGEYRVAEVVPGGYEQTFPLPAAAEAVSFDFEDIRATGTATMAGEDDATVSLTAGDLAGFEFRLFNTTYTQVHFSSNGLVTFAAANDDFDNTDLTIWPLEAAVAVFWDDLTAQPQGAAVYWQVLGSGDSQRLILQWQDLEFINGSDLGAITFQAVLREADNSIELNYPDLASGDPGAEGASATVGIKDAGDPGQHRLLLCHDSGPNEYVGTGKSTRVRTGGHIVPLAAAAVAANIHFGNNLGTTIGDMVWQDANRNGVQDIDEDGVDGATVHLYQPGGDGQPGGGDDIFVRSATTDIVGQYFFDRVEGGDYFLEFELTSGGQFTTRDAGFDDTLDSDADPVTGQTDVFSVSLGDYDDTRDAGVYFRFVDTAAAIAGVWASCAVWGDYDNDGDLDVLLAGHSLADDDVVADVYRNDAGAFTGIGAGLTAVYWSSAAWGDYDNDGDLDILLTGDDAFDTPTSKVYRNDAGSFTDVGAAIAAVDEGAVAWGDYDHDGDLDILLVGYTASDEAVSSIYRNDAGSFTDISASLEGVYAGSAAWGDYDNDGDLDILLTGFTASEQPVSKVYRNDAGVFTDIHAALEDVYLGESAWGDYDNDGDLDLLLTGYDASIEQTAMVYRNDAGSFTDIGAGLAGVAYSCVAWGDYDNDGDPDILVSGLGGLGEPISTVYRNDAGDFTDANAAVEGIDDGSVAWGDYDGDGDLDILLTGRNTWWETVGHVYRNDGEVFNTVPSAPTGLAAAAHAAGVTLSWDAAADGQTPPAGLTYNVRVGTGPGASDVVAPMADAGTGLRRLPATGNAQHHLSYSLHVTAPGTYYWSVQAVDTAFAGSSWAHEQTVTIGAAPQIAVTDGSGAPGDASIRFMTALSDFDPGATDSTLVRPAYPDEQQYFDVRNTGDAALTIHEIQITAPDVTVVDPPATDNIVLPPGQTRRFHLTYDPSVPTTSDPTTQDFDLADGLIIVSDAANDDAFPVALHGDSTFDSDISYDGRVNLAELGRLNANFGKTSDDPDFDPTADINGDGVVNLGDLGPLNAQFGLSRPASTAAAAQTSVAAPSAAAGVDPAPVPDAVQDSPPAQEHLAAAALMSETDDDEDEPASVEPAADLDVVDNAEVAPRTPEAVTSTEAAGHPTPPLDLGQDVLLPSDLDVEIDPDLRIADVLHGSAITSEGEPI